MAKISANGDTELARWKSPDGEQVLVLTQRGRLLRRILKGDSLRLVGRPGVHYTLAEVERYTAKRGYVRQ